MKKSLIAAAVAGLFAAPAAMADVTISGAINFGINIIGKSSNNTAGTAGLTNNSLGASYSNINIGSTDDIGTGNKVIFNYQLNVDPSSFANPTNRNSYLGVAGTWGAFKMGSNENVYERMMYTADPLDGAAGVGGNLNILGTPGVATVFDVDQTTATPTAGQVGFYRRSGQTIWYESPNYNGFSFEVDYTLSSAKTATRDPKLLSVGAKYAPAGMPFYVDIATEKHEDMFGANKLGAVGGTSSSDTGVQFGGGYTMGDLALHARYEQLKYETTGSTGFTEYKRNAYWFGVKYMLPSGYVGAELGKAGEGKTNVATVANTGATMLGLGYFHNLSKQSQLQFIYGNTRNDAAATYIQIGSPTNGAGADYQTLRFAIKHTF